MVTILITFACSLALPQQSADPWQRLRFLAGDWKGTSEGRPGAGTVTRSYEFIMNGRFLHERNVSTYAPQEKNPKGEVHEHRSLFSYDRARRTIVLRQFHAEGFVNQYALAPPSGDGTLLFESEAFENLPAGWRARERYEVPSQDEFVEIFELAAPGKDFEVYSRNRLQRAR